LQADLMHLSSKGKQVAPANSGHAIQFDAPGAVADAIQEVCQTLRGESRERQRFSSPPFIRARNTVY